MLGILPGGTDLRRDGEGPADGGGSLEAEPTAPDRRAYFRKSLRVVMVRSCRVCQVGKPDGTMCGTAGIRLNARERGAGWGVGRFMLPFPSEISGKGGHDDERGGDDIGRLGTRKGLSRHDALLGRCVGRISIH